MAARERRPPTDGEVVEYVATLVFIVAMATLFVQLLTGCTCGLAY